MKLTDLLNNEDICTDVDAYIICKTEKGIKGFHAIKTCQACAHWEEDLKFCKERKEIGWKPDDGCIKWLPAIR